MDYADLLSVTLRDDKVQEFDTRWDEVPLSVSKIPSDDILENRYKLRMRDSAQLKTVLELYDMEIHQKISMPDDQKLKAVIPTLHPASTRSESSSSTVRRSPSHEPEETEKQTIMETQRDRTGKPVA